jgi:hypothetical protein
MQSFSFPFVTLKDVSFVIYVVVCWNSAKFFGLSKLPYGAVSVESSVAEIHGCVVRSFHEV